MAEQTKPLQFAVIVMAGFVIGILIAAAFSDQPAQGELSPEETALKDLRPGFTLELTK